jgi:hypothetical protein
MGKQERRAYLDAIRACYLRADKASNLEQGGGWRDEANQGDLTSLTFYNNHRS